MLTPVVTPKNQVTNDTIENKSVKLQRDNSCLSQIRLPKPELGIYFKPQKRNVQDVIIDISLGLNDVVAFLKIQDHC